MREFGGLGVALTSDLMESKIMALSMYIKLSFLLFVSAFVSACYAEKNEVTHVTAHAMAARVLVGKEFGLQQDLGHVVRSQGRSGGGRHYLYSLSDYYLGLDVVDGVIVSIMLISIDSEVKPDLTIKLMATYGEGKKWREEELVQLPGIVETFFIREDREFVISISEKHTRISVSLGNLVLEPNNRIPEGIRID